MCYWLQDGAQCLETYSNIKQMGCKEEVIEVSKDGEYEIPQTVQESLKTENNNTYHP